jgi:hypothetical protein
MTVAERAGLTKKKDLALNFTGKPAKLTESGLETDGSAPGTPTRGGSRRGSRGFPSQPGRFFPRGEARQG